MLALTIEGASPLKTHQRCLQRIHLRLLPKNLAPDARWRGEVWDVARRRTPQRPATDAKVFDDGFEREIVFELHRYGLSWMSRVTRTRTLAPGRTLRVGWTVSSR